MTFFKDGKHGKMPGFALTWSFAIMYMSLLVWIPLSTVFLKTSEIGLDKFVDLIFEPRLVASYKLSFGAAFAAAAINAVFGVLAAWVLVRYSFPGRKMLDGLIDLPLALPTAVAGISLTAIYANNGPLGQLLDGIGVKSAFSPLGVVIALTFISLPFAIRVIQPVLASFDQEVEDAAVSLGAGRFDVFVKIIMPELIPAVLTGFALAFARALGEYGSVVFISGNLPMKTEITPLLIMVKLEQYDYAGANAIASVMLLASFAVLFATNILQWWSSRRHRAA